jgi:hypothetical protein
MASSINESANCCAWLRTLTAWSVARSVGASESSECSSWFLCQLVLLGERRNLGLEYFQVVSEPGHEGADLVWVEAAEPHSEILAAYVFVDWSVYAVGPFCSSLRALRYYRDLHGVI